jgi:hypothetical protein
VEVATDSNFVGTVFNDTTSALSKALTGLGSLTLYYWRVRAFNQLGGGAYSLVRRFTTDQAPIEPPPAPVLLSPALFAENVTIPVTLVWNASSGADFYRVQVSTSPSFGTTILNDSMVAVTSRAFSNLNGGTAYYWKVNARNGLGTGAWSDVWTFSTVLATPSVPQLVSPAQFAVNVNRDPFVTWNKVNGALTYRVQIALDAGFTSIVANDSTVTDTTFRPASLLAANADHFWRVNAKNAAGSSAYSFIWKFTTGTVIAVLPGRAHGSQLAYEASNGTLRFSLARPGRVVARLYTTQGRLVEVVLDQDLGAGSHAIVLPRGLGESLHLLEFRSGGRREWMKVHP